MTLSVTTRECARTLQNTKYFYIDYFYYFKSNIFVTGFKIEKQKKNLISRGINCNATVIK